MTLQRYRGSLHMDLPLTTASSDPVVAVTRILEWVNADEAEAEIARLDYMTKELQLQLLNADRDSYDQLRTSKERIAELEAENGRLRAALTKGGE